MATDEGRPHLPDIGSSTTSVPSEIECCSIPTSYCESDVSSGSSSSSLPSYIIVQRQIRDVVQAQQAAVEQLLKNNIEVLNESKASFDTIVTSQDQKIRMLENTIMDDYVPKEMYDSLRTEMKEMTVSKGVLEAVRTSLEQEYDSHNQTRAKLKQVLDKLDASLTQVTSLTRQSEEDKMAFDSACDSLRHEISDTQARNRDLESRLAEKSLMCETQQYQLTQQLDEIAALHQQHQSQTVKYKHMVMEADVERQQEVYLSQIFSGRKKLNI